ncbi:MAG: cytochrome c/FTR1 family iron permease [Gammaproteobacteria bacterium]|nr:cytochrome c/FTR1 family iron permease [Gammaproteobacteria bacterium]
MYRLFIRTLLLLALPGLALASPDLSKLVQLVDYVGVDYRGAVQDGKIVNPAEYDEMRDFTRAIEEQIQQLPETINTANIHASARQLAQLVEQKRTPDTVAATAAELRHTLIGTFEIAVVPRMAPDLPRARQLFSDNCAACHGLTGQGNGIQARSMDPAPTDFTNGERYGQRTVYGLYSTISAGVGDTAMRGFTELSDEDRWSVAFLVGQMATTETARDAGKAALAAKAPASALADLQRFTVTTPDEAGAAYGNGGAEVMAYLRAHPESMFANAAPLDYARDTLAASLDAYRNGQRETAYKLAVAAYLEGFELVEHSLDTVDSELRAQVETEMTNYRNLLRNDNAINVVEDQATRVRQLLDEVSTRLSAEGSLSTGAAFASAFIILLREGLEAILVIAALAAFLIKTERRDAMLYLHYGWVSALLLGMATWIASMYLFDFSGAGRELTEGVGALVAMAVLFYVGFWMHSKTNAVQWKRFIDGSVQKALGTGTLWGLTGLSFIAVYREVFETILFYQALWVQADMPAQTMLVSGLGSGIAALVVLSWLILRYSTRLPLRQFFSATSIFMFVLAVVFAGKGIAALQEAGKLPLDPIDFPRIDLLGIYPNLQGLAVQGGLLMLAVLILWISGLKQRSAAA